MKSVNTAWCPHDYKKSSPLDVRWTRVTHPMGTRLTQEDQIAHAFGRLSLFFHCTCVQTSLFYPLRMCFRSRVFRRLFFSTAHPHRRLIFSAEHAFSVSLFLFRCLSLQTSPFFRCAWAQKYLFSFPLCIRSVVSLLWKAEKKGRGCSLGGDAWQPPSKPCLKFQTKICDLPYLSTATIDKKKRTYLISVPGNRKHETITLYRTQKVKILSNIQD